jgi:hypothetical protein
MTPEERFLGHVTIEDDGCWIFQKGNRGTGGFATREGTGYGQFRLDGKRYMAHRWAYTHWVGPIAARDQLDHTCRNRKCCNPDHLEPVSSYENMRRLRFAQVLQARIEDLEAELARLKELM